VPPVLAATAVPPPTFEALPPSIEEDWPHPKSALAAKHRRPITYSRWVTRSIRQPLALMSFREVNGSQSRPSRLQNEPKPITRRQRPPSPPLG
jgi:hypothetical protein